MPGVGVRHRERDRANPLKSTGTSPLGRVPLGLRRGEDADDQCLLQVL